MTFPTERSLDKVHGEQVLACKCYVQELRNGGRDLHVTKVTVRMNAREASLLLYPQFIEHGVETLDEQKLKQGEVNAL